MFRRLNVCDVSDQTKKKKKHPTSRKTNDGKTRTLVIGAVLAVEVRRALAHRTGGRRIRRVFLLVQRVLKAELGRRADDGLDEHGERVVARLDHWQFDEIVRVAAGHHAVGRVRLEIDTLLAVVVVIVVGGARHALVDIKVWRAL